MYSYADVLLCTLRGLLYESCVDIKWPKLSRSLCLSSFAWMWILLASFSVAWLSPSFSPMRTHNSRKPLSYNTDEGEPSSLGDGWWSLEKRVMLAESCSLCPGFLRSYSSQASVCNYFLTWGARVSSLRFCASDRDSMLQCRVSPLLQRMFYQRTKSPTLTHAEYKAILIKH